MKNFVAHSFTYPSLVFKHIRGNGSPIWRLLAAFVPALVMLLAAAPSAQAQGCVPLGPYATDADRIGFNVIVDYGKSFVDYDTNAMNAGWFLDYRPSPYLGPRSNGLEAEEAGMVTGMAHAPLLRIAEFDDGTWRMGISNLVSRNPGMLWIIGNEPDRHKQDMVTPQVYAEKYHDAYEVIKAADPTSLVAIAAVVEPTPLRRRYLDMVLDEYQRRYGEKMPVDVWNVHAFILREDNQWGAGIPLGLEAWAHEGMLYEVPDHGDIEVLRGLIRDFRSWMAARGYQNRPLIITEYGILLAPYYDAGNGRVFDEEFVSEYMVKSFDFFRTASSYKTGYPADDYHLVQAWSWFGLNNYVYSEPDRMDGFNGNLADHDSGLTTALGAVFSAYTARYHRDYMDLALRSASVSRTQIPARSADLGLAVNVSAYNRGNVPAADTRIRIWLGEPGPEGRLLKEAVVSTALDRRCRNVSDLRVPFRLPELKSGFHLLTVEIVSSDGGVDVIEENNQRTFRLEVGDVDEWKQMYLPATRG